MQEVKRMCKTNQKKNTPKWCNPNCEATIRKLRHQESIIEQQNESEKKTVFHLIDVPSKLNHPTALMCGKMVVQESSEERKNKKNNIPRRTNGAMNTNIKNSRSSHFFFVGLVYFVEEGKIKLLSLLWHSKNGNSIKSQLLVISYSRATALDILFMSGERIYRIVVIQFEHHWMWTVDVNKPYLKREIWYDRDDKLKLK